VRRIRERLAGHQILVTGSTGFLAKALIEKLLRSVDTIGGLTLLVRSRPDGNTAERRVRRDVLGSRAFDRIRALLGDGFERLCQEKISVVAGDLSRKRLGLDPGVYEQLTRRITLVINSAATVTFDEQLDLAVELNTLGPARLLQFARDCGNIPMMHVSTCYVAGARTGTVVEDFSAPPQARESLPRIQDTGEFDLDRLIGSLLETAAEIRRTHGEDAEDCRQRLVDAGMQAARRHGWNDTYTFTKWIGEQLLKRDHGPVTVVVFRPAIIESSLEEPAPGWIDGLRMADPLIVAYGRGKLGACPARPQAVVDFIPVDFVVNAMLATIPVGDDRQRPISVYQCGSSDHNPLTIAHMGEAVVEAFRRSPMVDDEGTPIRPKRLSFVPGTEFVERFSRARRRIDWLARLLRRFNANSRRARKLAAVSRQIEQLLYFAKIYSPYTHLTIRFADDELRQVAQGLHPEDVAEFPFDVEKINWRDYLMHRHVPGLRLYVLGTGVEPTARIRGAVMVEPAFRAGVRLLEGKSIFDVFSRCVERHPDKHALQVRRNGRWIRYTYREALDATGSVVKRLLERGLRRDDRVAICAESSPEWGLLYLAVMRAGMTAVPLDPQLPPADAWAAARFAGAKLMCAGPQTLDGLAEKRTADDPELVCMDTPFIPPPGASRDPAPDPAPVDDTDLASILFTSGTTVEPRAVQLTHRNLVANAKALVQVHPVYSDDEFLSVLPMHHAFEFTGGFLVPMAGGATVTYLEQLKGPEIVAAVKATGTTVMMVVPRLLQMFRAAILDRVSSSRVLRRAAFRVLSVLSRLTGHRYARVFFRSVQEAFGGRMRMFFSGASRLDPEVFASFESWGLPICEGYGLTETSPVLTVNPPGRRRIGSVGKPLPNVELVLRNKNLEGIGEVWARGDSVMRGYLNNPEATREVLVNGWFRTGDLGYFDVEGYLYITGRSKDLIVTSAGKNVYPDEVEFAYRDLPYVKELCVLAMPTPDGVGDAVHAAAVVEPEEVPGLDRSSIERAIRSAAVEIGESIPSHQRITAFHFWYRELPKTTTLKAKRSVIRDMLMTETRHLPGAALERSTGEEEPTYREVREDSPGFVALRTLLARQTGKDPKTIAPCMNLLLDLGIDSIGKIDLIGQIEAQFGMRIDNERAAAVARVADLAYLIGNRKPKTAVPRAAGSWQRRVTASDDHFQLNGSVPVPLVPMRLAVRGTIGLLMNTYVRVRSVGLENIPRTGAFILAPNHCSHLDSPAVVTAIRRRRRVWVAGAEDYFFDTALKRLVFGRMLDTIAFDRHADGLQGLRRCDGALRCGDGLLLFPEGTRSVTGRMQPFKIGVAVLAVERQVPIVPVYIRGTHDLFPKGHRFVRPGIVTVLFGEPVEPPALGEDADHYVAFREMTDRVQTAVAMLAKKV
jgi:long-chain acyl-CoA synthetase